MTNIKELIETKNNLIEELRSVQNCIKEYISCSDIDINERWKNVDELSEEYAFWDSDIFFNSIKTDMEYLQSIIEQLEEAIDEYIYINVNKEEPMNVYNILDYAKNSAVFLKLSKVEQEKVELLLKEGMLGMGYYNYVQR